MYTEFSNAAIDSRHVMKHTNKPAALAAQLQQLIQEGSLERLIESPATCPG